MDSDGPAVGSAVPLDAPEDQTEGNQGSSCLTDAASPESDLSTALKDDKAIPDTTTFSGSEEKQEKVEACQFFLKGKCHFGQRCRLSHSLSAVEDSEATLPDHESGEDDQKADKNKKKKGKVSKTTKPKDAHGEETTKKPRMRTADEVISRVLWDPLVEASEFVVGYVDRFLGVLERPFSDFNWDVDPCDCNYTTELALPRHRILYFSFQGHRVWDRHSRTDRVFGSTGHTLAPPFGAGEEVGGVNSQDTGQQDPLESESLELAEGRISDDNGQQGGESKDCDETRRLDEDKHGIVNISTTDSTQQKPNDTGSSTQEDQQETGRNSKADMEGALIGSQPSTKQESHVQLKGETGEEKNAEEWKESWEGDSEELHFHLNQNPNASLEQREKPSGGGRPPKRKPTHFITFRANTPSILSSFQRLQEELTSLLPSSAPHWKASSTLHVTLCLLVLPGPAEVAAAGEILRRIAFLDRNPPVAVTFPVKLKHFSGKVLYLSPQPQLQLQQLNSGLQEAYRKEGLLHRHSFNPRYHLTLAKVEDREGERVFEGVGDLKVGKGLNFGRLPVNTLHLCSMGKSKVDGFYEILCTVTFR